MAPVRLEDIKPRGTISEKTTPEPLRRALIQLFSEVDEGLWLVGGTALAGYYAEHRHSDDLDLFVADSDTYRATVLTVKSLKKLGAAFRKETSTPNFYKGHLELRNLFFTVDVVLDENLHRLGQAMRTDDGVFVADLSAIFAMKAACLLSRCSEKDLYDLVWLFEKMGGIDVGQIVERGLLVDGGMNIEGLLISLKGITLRKEACDFLLDRSQKATEEAHQKILDLQKALIEALLDYEKKQPPSKEVQALSESIKYLKKRWPQQFGQSDK